MKQAVVIAAIFEFGGAMLLGRVIQDTISGGIADVAAFTHEPEVFAYGMMVALFVGGVWQIAASRLEMNVSATHSIIGAIVGFTIAFEGAGAVVWARTAPRVPGERRPFPPVKGVVPIVLSWFVSPVLAALASAAIFGACRVLVLRRQRAFALSFALLPLLVLLTVFINVYFVLTKGAAKTLKKTADWSETKAIWVALSVAGGAALLTGLAVVPALWARIKTLERRAADEAAAATARAAEDDDTCVPSSGRAAAAAPADDAFSTAAAPRTGLLYALRRAFWRLRHSESVNSIQRAAMHGVEVDIHAIVEDDPVVKAIHAHAEVFDARAERVFSYLQVFSAICVIFAHGAGEVGYMSGPLGAIWQVVSTGSLAKKVAPPLWVLLLSALGLVLGLATYGYNITRAIGTRMAKLTPSRGFAAELATSLVVLVASQYGLPTSTSQCITGAVIGVALLEGAGGFNWRFFARTFASWVATVALVALVTGLLFACGVYAPSVQCGDALREYERGVARAAGDALDGYSASIRASGYDTGDVAGNAFARSLAVTRANVAALPDVQTVKPAQALGYLGTALALWQPALALNASAPRVCPAAAAEPAAPCTLPRAQPQPPVALTPLRYGADAPPLDARAQRGAICTRLPCNQ
jgi:sodium-dependent phosphate transporter